MSPTTYRDGQLPIEHEGDQPPAEEPRSPGEERVEHARDATNQSAPATEQPPKPPRSQTRKRAGKIANAQARQRRLGKHRK